MYPKTMSPTVQCLSLGLLHGGTVRSPGLPTSVRQDSASSLPAPPSTTDRVGEGDPEMGPDDPRSQDTGHTLIPLADPHLLSPV